MDRILCAVTITGLLIMITTYIYQIVRIGLSKSHPQLPKSVYFPMMVLRIIAIICLGVALLGPKGWVFDNANLRRRTGKWWLLVYVALTGFFLMWPIMLFCVVRERDYECDLSKAARGFLAIAIGQCPFILLSFAAVQRPIRPEVLWPLVIFGSIIVMVDLYLWISAIDANRNKLSVGFATFDLRD